MTSAAIFSVCFSFCSARGVPERWRDLVVGVVFFCFLGLGDDGIEIVVTEEEDAEEIVGGLVGGLELDGATGGGDRFFDDGLVGVF